MMMTAQPEVGLMTRAIKGFAREMAPGGVDSWLKAILAPFVAGSRGYVVLSRQAPLGRDVYNTNKSPVTPPHTSR